MSTQSENDDLLRQQMRREARRSRPAFSDTLHARLLSAISGVVTHDWPVAANRARPTMRRQVLSWTMTASAAIAMTFALALLWNASRRAEHDVTARNTDGGGSISVGRNPNELPPQTGAANAAPDDFDSVTEEVAQSASGISEWVFSAADQNQWAGLDRDAQAALAAVAGPLPFDLAFALDEPPFGR